MKKILFAFIALASLSFQAEAQVKREQKANKSEMHAKKNKQKGVVKDLDLTAEQQAKLKASRENAKLKMDAIKNDNTLSEAQKKERMEVLRKEQKANMENILTREQKEKMKKAQKERMDKKEDRDDNDKKYDKANRDKVKQNNGLSNEQAAKIKAYNQASHQRMKAIKDNPNLTQAQKKERLKEEQKAKKEFLNNLLTPDQKKIMKEKKEEKKDWKENKGKKPMKTKMKSK